MTTRRYVGKQILLALAKYRLAGYNPTLGDVEGRLQLPAGTATGERIRELRTRDGYRIRCQRAEDGYWRYSLHLATARRIVRLATAA